MDFRILGPLEVVADGRRLRLGGPKQRGVLALLVVRPGRVVAADQLIEELWQGRPPTGAEVAMRQHVSRLRTALKQGLDRPVLLTRPPGYLLQIDPADVDAHRFERLAAEGRAALADGRPGEATQMMRSALELWRGPVLADLADLPALATERSRMAELRLTAVETRIEAELTLGQHEELAGELEALLAAHPLRERLYALRMVALYGAGRQAEALAVFRDARRVLTEELGVEPGEALSQVQLAILRHDPSLGQEVRLPSLVRDGLDIAVARTVYEPFVGRAAELARLRAALDGARGGSGRLVMLAGEPGAGKTRISREVAEHAQRAGFEVMTGKAWEEEGAPAFWPWMQVLRRWAGSSEATALRGQPVPRRRCLASSFRRWPLGSPTYPRRPGWIPLRIASGSSTRSPRRSGVPRPAGLCC